MLSNQLIFQHDGSISFILQHCWWRPTVQASINNFRRFWDSNHNFKSSFCIFLQIYWRTSEHSSRQRYGSGVSIVISTAGSSAWPTIKALPSSHRMECPENIKNTHTLRLGRTPPDPFNPGLREIVSATAGGCEWPGAFWQPRSDRVSIQSNLGAHEKSTLDNRQFLCSAASRGVTRLVSAREGEDRDEEARGDHGPVMWLLPTVKKERRKPRKRMEH